MSPSAAKGAENPEGSPAHKEGGEGGGPPPNYPMQMGNPPPYMPPMGSSPRGDPPRGGGSTQTQQPGSSDP